MHILFPIGSFYPSQAGGPSNSVYWLAKMLLRAGYKITIVTTNHDIPSRMCDRWIHMEAGRVQYVSTFSHLLPLGLIYRAVKQVDNAQIIHLTSVFYAPSLPIAIWSLWKGKKILWSVRGELAGNALLYNSFLKKAYLLLVRCCAQAVVFHSTSPVETAQIRTALGPAIKVAEVPNFLELPERLERRPATVFLLYIGRIHSIKALDNLLDALAYLRQKSRIVRLKIAGRGDAGYTMMLQQKAQELGIDAQIEWMGEVTGQAKQQLLADAHYTVLASYTENFGIVVTESLAQGTPVIASHGTPWQVLEEVRAGRWVSNDAPSLAEAIDTLLQLPEHEYAAMRERAMRLAEERFDIHRNVHRWHEVYQQMVQTHKTTLK